MASSPELATVAGVAVLNRRLGALPAVGGNTVDLFSDYPASLEAMSAAVDSARSFVHVEFYITAWDDATTPFFEALVRATERGVRVRLLFDHLGSRGIPVYRETLRRLEETSIRWHPMMPIQLLRGKVRRPDLRNHRKILVVDGTCAFAGSQNLIEASYDKAKNHRAGRAWVELMARITGPAVAELNAVFLTDWYSETGEIPLENAATPGPRPRRDLPRARPRRRRDGPGRAQRPGLHHREQPAHVHDADLRRAAADLADQPLLRARRVTALRGDDGRATRRGRRAVRGSAG